MIIDITVHADMLCPWCYIEKRSLESAMDRFRSRHPGVDFNVRWKPFLLYPTLRKGDKQTIYEAIAKPEKYSAVSERINKNGRKYGINFSIYGITGPSQASHLLIAYTLSTLGQEAQSEVVEAIFRGHFEEGRDITDEIFLLEVGARVGLKSDEVRRVVRGEEGFVTRICGNASIVEEEVRRAMVMGVRAVPCVTVAERFMVGGFQEERVFEDVFEKARREKRDSR